VASAVLLLTMVFKKS